MADTVSAAYELKIATTHTLDLAGDFAADVAATHNIGVVSGTIDGSSTVTATKVYSESYTLAGGVENLDLTSLTGLYGASVDFTGLKVQLVHITNPAGNGVVTIDMPAADHYNLFGPTNATAGLVVLSGGDSIALYHPNVGEDVDATHKLVRLNGTAADELYIHLVAG